ncbi:beta-1,3-galactosyltransferase 1-like [Haliotis asinina]|uniref:beta-1,3-galactosyltransferase 1-like n=1 Tax=Haliotis asinina TaxID=109174 RepID=UPI0035319CC8
MVQQSNLFQVKVVFELIYETVEVIQVWKTMLRRSCALKIGVRLILFNITVAVLIVSKYQSFFSVVKREKSAKSPNLDPLPQNDITISRYDVINTSSIDDVGRWFDSHDTEADVLLNLHSFQYHLQSDICSRREPNVIVLVSTAAKHFRARDLIRQTWASVKHVGGVSISTVFFVGLPYTFARKHVHRREKIWYDLRVSSRKKNVSVEGQGQAPRPGVQGRLESEATRYGDIVQGNFVDSYRNLTYKHIMALGWVESRCPKVKVIVKMDDDVMLNVYNLAKFVRRNEELTRSFYCFVMEKKRPFRLEGTKWFVTEKEYPFKNYPTFCKGFGYLTSPEVARTLYAASRFKRFYWIDDVFVTGILSMNTGLTFNPLEKEHSYSKDNSSISDRLFIDVVTQKNGYSLWNTIQSKRQIG